MAEAETTIYIEFLNLCTICASVPCKRDFLHFLNSQQNKTHNEREPAWNKLQPQ